MRATLSGYAHRSRDHVRVVCTPTAVTSFAPKDIAEFLSRHPSVNVKLDEHMAADVVRRVEEGHADLGIIWDKTASAALETVPYRHDRMVLVVNRNHPLASRERVRFTEILPFDCVTVYAASVAQHLQQRAAIAEGRALRSSVHVRTYEGACHIVAAGLGIALVPDVGSRTLIDALRLVAIPLDEEWALRRFVVCMRDRAGLTLSARQLLESLAAHAAECPAR
jgi:DNA-binding transcriptional LysR family regulator